MKHRWGLLVAFLPALASGAARAGEAMGRETVLRAKAATALLLRSRRGQMRMRGTAFCISGDGLFLTSSETVRDAKERGEGLKLVVRPGQPGQTVLAPELLREDAKLGMALLRVTVPPGVKPAVLEIGEARGLHETMGVWVFGFSRRQSADVAKGNYFAPGAHLARIAALQKRNGELQEVRLTGQLDLGYWGAPVLTPEGRVVAMVRIATPEPAAEANFAEPANRLRSFLRTPAVKFSAPELSVGSLHRPAKYSARIVSFVRRGRPLAARLTLSHAGRKKAVALLPTGKAHEATAALRQTPVKGRVRITAVYPLGVVSCECADRLVSVAGRKIALGQISEIDLEGRPFVALRSGELLRGPVGGLDGVEADLGSQRAKLDLGKAARVRIRPVLIEARVEYVLEVLDGAEVVAREEGQIAVAGSVSASPLAVAATSRPAEAPARLPVFPAPVRDIREIKTPGPIGDVDVGGGGRFLVLHFRALRKLGVFDVSEAKIVRYLPVGADTVYYAAGRTKLVMALPEQRIIQRWGLLTGRKELTTTLPFGSIHGMAMGSDADEYVLVAGGTQTSSRSRTGLGFLDVQSLRPGKIKISGTTLSSTGRGVHLRASANGMVYGCWTVGVTPSRIGIIVVTGDRAAARRPHWSGGVVLPNPDGSVVFQVNQLYSRSLEPLSESLGRSGKGFFPAVRGSYFLGLVSGPGYATSSWSSQTRGAARLSLFILGHDQPLLTLDPIDVGLGSTPNSSFAAFTADKMYHLIPEAELLILVPPARNRLILKHLGIKAALDNSGVDYLFVTSFPPPSVEKGSVYRYKPATMSRQGGVKYNLASSPEGMRLMEGAEIVWPVPQGFKDSTASVILQVGDKSGREIHHTFTIRVK